MAEMPGTFRKALAHSEAFSGSTASNLLRTTRNGFRNVPLEMWGDITSLEG